MYCALRLYSFLCTSYILAYLIQSSDADAKEKLTRNATQLLNGVRAIIQAIDTATITLSDEAREQLDLPKWVKLSKRKSISRSSFDSQDL